MTQDNVLIAEVDIDGFDDVLAADQRAVLADFTADWCPPCRALHPRLERLAETHAPRLRVVSVDADTVHEPMRRYGVYNLPTLLLFDGATLLARLSGEPPEQLEEVVRLLDARDRLAVSLRTDPVPVAPAAARTLRMPAGPPPGILMDLVPPSGDLQFVETLELSGDAVIPSGFKSELLVVQPESTSLDEGRNADDPDPARLVPDGVPDLDALRSFGPDDVDELVVMYAPFSDADLRGIMHLTGLRTLRLVNHDVSDAGLATLASLPGLIALAVSPRQDGSEPDPGVLAQLQRENLWLSVNVSWIHPQLRT